jgi:hypothetical protein
MQKRSKDCWFWGSNKTVSSEYFVYLPPSTFHEKEIRSKVTCYLYVRLMSQTQFIFKKFYISCKIYCIIKQLTEIHLLVRTSGDDIHSPQGTYKPPLDSSKDIEAQKGKGTAVVRLVFALINFIFCFLPLYCLSLCQTCRFLSLCVCLSQQQTDMLRLHEYPHPRPRLFHFAPAASVFDR